jgi:hypothetical protein
MQRLSIFTYLRRENKKSIALFGNFSFRTILTGLNSYKLFKEEVPEVLRTLDGLWERIGRYQQDGEK